MLQAKRPSKVEQSGGMHKRTFLKILVINCDTFEAFPQRGDQFAFARLIEMINIRVARAAAPTVRHR